MANMVFEAPRKIIAYDRNWNLLENFHHLLQNLVLGIYYCLRYNQPDTKQHISSLTPTDVEKVSPS